MVVVVTSVGYGVILDYVGNVRCNVGACEVAPRVVLVCYELSARGIINCNYVTDYLGFLS